MNLEQKIYKRCAFDALPVRQFVAPFAGVPLATLLTVAPLRKAVSVAVEVEGPVIEKVSKSSLICKKLRCLNCQHSNCEILVNFSVKIQNVIEKEK